MIKVWLPIITLHYSQQKWCHIFKNTIPHASYTLFSHCPSVQTSRCSAKYFTTLRMDLMHRNPTPYLSKWATCLQLMFFNGGTLSAGLPIWWSVTSCINDIFVGYVQVEGSGLSRPRRKPTKSQFCPSKRPLPLLVPLGPLPCQPLPLPGPPLCSNKCTVPKASAKSSVALVFLHPMPFSLAAAWPNESVMIRWPSPPTPLEPWPVRLSTVIFGRTGPPEPSPKAWLNKAATAGVLRLVARGRGCCASMPRAAAISVAGLWTGCGALGGWDGIQINLMRERMKNLLVLQCGIIVCFVCFCMCVSLLLFVLSPSYGTVSLDMYDTFSMHDDHWCWL